MAIFFNYFWEKSGICPLLFLHEPQDPIDVRGEYGRGTLYFHA